ncbi:hypothetical protein BT63DRAFT_456549 [Microthyrium microscopicum]|uniref:Peptidase M43 pregnancy-associated plasma-A domain-containing protein n=1 Tax=Microthyrium microscopicum TaxID=703497 RepID=A0A6A6U4M9_9PEZI|nr:hypothetical protein BT63DRAFT_456549 [Microthyrium microscopicum]
MKFLFAGVATSLSPLVLGLDDQSRVPTFSRCGNENVTIDPALQAIASQVNAKFLANPSQKQWNNVVTVDTHFHVVTTGTEDKPHQISNSMINAQGDTMNAAYAPAGTEMMAQLRKGGYDTLNVFFLTDMGPGLLGECVYPIANFKSAPSFDGCWITAGTVPGGPGGNGKNGFLTAYNRGYTAVHEVGHWLGLHHPWDSSNGTCGPDDGVADTPIQGTPSFGCPQGKDSCPGFPGLDSIHNYMDYADDACMNQFTNGQAALAHSVFDKLRRGK